MFDIDFTRLIEQLIYQPQSPMIFSSGIFLFLFLGFTLIYNLLGKADTLRILFVTLFSYYFYYTLLRRNMPEDIILSFQKSKDNVGWHQCTGR